MATVANYPHIIPLNEKLATDRGSWDVSLVEEPREFADRTCLHYKYRFQKDDREHTVVLLVPRHDMDDPHRREELRRAICDHLAYSNDNESVLNPLGCPVE